MKRLSLLCKAVLASVQFALDFFKCLWVLHFIPLYGALSLHKLCSSSGSLFCTHLGGIEELNAQ